MSETKRYYLGTGTEFIKAQCKEYKTIDGVLKAAAKDESFVVWDEDGNVIGSLTDDVSEGTLGGQDATVYDAESGENEDKSRKSENDAPAQEKAENEAHRASEEDTESTSGGDEPEDEHPEEVPGGITNEQVERFNITVSCEGSLRLRRSPSFTEDNECGRASKGQRYIGKRLFMVDGLPMAETIDGLFLSAAAEHVTIDKAGA